MPRFDPTLFNCVDPKDDEKLIKADKQAIARHGLVLWPADKALPVVAVEAETPPSSDPATSISPANIRRGPGRSKP